MKCVWTFLFLVKKIHQGIGGGGGGDILLSETKANDSLSRSWCAEHHLTIFAPAKLPGF